jgi:hypothetical protein
MSTVNELDTIVAGVDGSQTALEAVAGPQSKRDTCLAPFAWSMPCNGRSSATPYPPRLAG